GKPEEAMMDFEEALKAQPNDIYALCFHSLVKIKMNKLEEAQKSLDDAFKVHPFNPMVLYWRGYVSKLLGFSDAAQTYYSLACKVNNKENYFNYLNETPPKDFLDKGVLIRLP